MEVESSLLKPYIPEYKESFIEEEITEDVKVSNKRSISKDGKDKKSNVKKANVKHSDVNEIARNNTKSKRNTKYAGKKSEKGKTIQSKTDIADQHLSNEDELEEITKYKSYLENDIPKKELSLLSNRQSWNKIIEFNDPAIEVGDFELVHLRDIFRTNLTLRLVHIKASTNCFK